MVPAIPVLLVTTAVLILLWSPAQAQHTEWCLKAKKARKPGIGLDCRPLGEGSRIVSLSVAGAARKSTCRGLTADLFVQMNLCLWKERCTIKQQKHDKYMLKLFHGQLDQCITKTASKFHVSYQCAAAGVDVVDVISPGESRQEVTSHQGIVRSHEDHPWMYRRPHGSHHVLLTLRNPRDGALHFVYTIRTLKLMWNDVLKVSWTGQTNNFAEYRDDITNKTPDVIEGAESVSFHLHTSHFSTGREGFVVCFKWLEDPASVADACSGMVSPGPQPPGSRACRKRGKGKKGKKDKKGKKRRNKNKKPVSTP